MSVSLLQGLERRRTSASECGHWRELRSLGRAWSDRREPVRRDILGQQGLRWIVVFEGVNDIGAVNSSRAATSTATNLIAAYQQFIGKARTAGVRIYGATIMPFNGNGYYNQYSEQCRTTVNQWIRAEGNFDACIDFDLVMRNPADTTRLLLPAIRTTVCTPIRQGTRSWASRLTTPSSPMRLRRAWESCGSRSRRRPFWDRTIPNPFNPTTIIGYSLPGRAHVSLSVYNTLGQPVSDLQNGEQDAGYHEARFDGKDLPSGVYFYRLQSGSYIETKRSLLVR